VERTPPLLLKPRTGAVHQLKKRVTQRHPLCKTGDTHSTRLTPRGEEISVDVPGAIRGFNTMWATVSGKGANAVTTDSAVQGGRSGNKNNILSSIHPGKETEQ